MATNSRGRDAQPFHFSYLLLGILSSEDGHVECNGDPLSDVFPNSYIPLFPFDKIPLHKTLKACLDVGWLWSEMFLDRINRQIDEFRIS